MRVVVFGKSGHLGRELVRVFSGRGHQVIGFQRSEVDVTDDSRVEHAIATATPDIVVNATAYNMVDVAEKEPDTAFAGNALAVRNMAVACRQADARFVHFSTDYVFDGTLGRPYVEDDPTHPVGLTLSPNWQVNSTRRPTRMNRSSSEHPESSGREDCIRLAATLSR